MTIVALERELERGARRRRAVRWVGAIAAASAVAAAVGAHGHVSRASYAFAKLGPPPRAAPIVAYPLGGGPSVWRAPRAVHSQKGAH